jgi:tRNA (guanine-N7-)-methyltransferase
MNPNGMAVDYSTIISGRREALAKTFSAILPDRKPFVWELGCGHGHFLTAYAAEHRDQLCIGIDVAGDRIERATRKQSRAALPNLHFIRTDAALFLETLPANAEIAKIFILFPDPWPKSRHHKHRVLQPAFLAQLAPHTTAACHMHFRTDHHEYFESAYRSVEQSPNWEHCREPWPFEYQTVFQNRALQHESFTATRRPRCA